MPAAEPRPHAHEDRFRAMGSGVHVIVVGGRARLAAATTRLVEHLEARWSRFLPASDISRLNTARGEPVPVASETLAAVAVAVDAWRLTGGLYDPTVLAALESAGYDRSFELVARAGPRRPFAPAVPAPGCAGIDIDRRSGTIRLPPRVRLDLGGIGKGLAADVAVDAVIAEGAAGACVNVGGDLRVRGEAPGPDGWVVSVEHPADTRRELVRLALQDGAVATTSRRGKSWRRGGQRLHHVIDPSSGRPASRGPLAATIVDGVCWRAEALAKAVVVGGLERGGRLVIAAGASGIAVGEGAVDGVRTIGGLEAFAR